VRESRDKEKAPTLRHVFAFLKVRERFSSTDPRGTLNLYTFIDLPSL